MIKTVLKETGNVFKRILSPPSGEGKNAKLSWDGLIHLFRSVPTEDDPFQLTAVFDGLRIISDSISSMPIAPYNVGDKGRVKLRQHHNFRLLQKEPNRFQTAAVFWKFMEWCRQSRGNAYAMIVWNEATRRAESLIPLKPWNVTPYYDWKSQIVWYKVIQDGIKGWLHQDDVIHLKNVSFDGVVGVSGIQVCKVSLGLGTALQTYGRDLYQHGSHSKGFIQHPAELSDKGYKRLKQDIEENFHGAQSAGRIQLLEGGATYQSIGIDPQDAEFITSRKFTTEEVARMLNIPLVKLKDVENAHYNNVEQMDLSYMQQTLLPLINDIESELDKKLLHESEKRDGIYHEFNMNVILRADMDTRRQFYSSGIQNGWLLRNDVRRMENLQDLEHGSEEMVPTFVQKPEQMQANLERTKKETEQAGKDNGGNNRSVMNLEREIELTRHQILEQLQYVATKKNGQ